MNLNYEVADSQGRTPYKNRGQWFALTANDDWQTYTWHVTDACFARMCGYDFSLRPEQSLPFVIGKVEVSTIQVTVKSGTGDGPARTHRLKSMTSGK